jgi:hypothetical protein
MPKKVEILKEMTLLNSTEMSHTSGGANYTLETSVSAREKY